MLRGSMRGRRNSPPAAATSERFTSGMPNDAAVDATTMSHARTISVPPASAGPSTAAMSGLVRGRATSPPKPPRFGLEVAGLALVDRLQVGAGAEHVALGGEHTQPDLGVLLELIERGFHAPRDVAVDGVLLLGTVDLEDADTPADFVVDHGA